MFLGQRYSYWANSESGETKIVLKMISSRELPDSSNNGISQGMKVWMSSNPILPSFGGCQASGVHLSCKLLVLKATMDLVSRRWNKAS